MNLLSGILAARRRRAERLRLPPARRARAARRRDRRRVRAGPDHVAHRRLGGRPLAPHLPRGRSSRSCCSAGMRRSRTHARRPTTSSSRDAPTAGSSSRRPSVRRRGRRTTRCRCSSSPGSACSSSPIGPGHPAPAQGRPRGARGVDRRRGAAVPRAAAARRARSAPRSSTGIPRRCTACSRSSSRASSRATSSAAASRRARRRVRRPRGGPARAARATGPVPAFVVTRDPRGRATRCTRAWPCSITVLFAGDLRERAHRPLLPRPAVLRLVVARRLRRARSSTGCSGPRTTAHAGDRPRRRRRPVARRAVAIVLGSRCSSRRRSALRDRWSDQDLSTDDPAPDWLDEAFAAHGPERASCSRGGATPRRCGTAARSRAGVRTSRSSTTGPGSTSTSASVADVIEANIDTRPVYLIRVSTRPRSRPSRTGIGSSRSAGPVTCSA